jgi:hypothetical protein
MSQTAKEVGDRLERAVHAVETAILRSMGITEDDHAVTIRPKVKTKVDGVLHEIDLHVKLNFPRGYDTIFIFECRNRKDAVSKNDIIVFSEKIRAVNASKGFFVAKSFGEFAVAQARQDPRIELIEAQDSEVDVSIFPEMQLMIEDVSARMYSIGRGIIGRQSREESAPVSVEFSKMEIEYNGLLVDSVQFITSLGNEVVARRMATEDTVNLPEGRYEFDGESTLSFRSGSLRVNRKTCSHLTVRVHCVQHIIRPAIVSRFDIVTRGRVVEYEAATPKGGFMRLNIAAVDRNTPISGDSSEAA